MDRDLCGQQAACAETADALNALQTRDQVLDDDLRNILLMISRHECGEASVVNR